MGAVESMFVEIFMNKYVLDTVFMESIIKLELI